MQSRESIKKKVKNTAVCGVLGAAALALSFAESLIPPIAFMPPGAKLGLSNIAVMFAAMTLGLPQGIFIVILKSCFVFLTRGAASFFMSLAGGLLSYFGVAVMISASRKVKKEISYIGISVISAVLHNIGQVAAASIYTKTNLVFSYMPILILFGVGAGIITGVILRVAIPAIRSIVKN